MANTKTAKKQILITKRNHERNLAIKSRLKSVLKKAKAAIAAATDQADAQVALNDAVKTLYKTASKGIIKKQNASRRVGRLMHNFKHAFGLGSEQAPTAAPATEAPSA